MPITREMVPLKAKEVAKEQNLQAEKIKDSMGWCRHTMPFIMKKKNYSAMYSK